MINYDYIGDEQLELSVCFDKVGLIPISEITNEKIFLNCPISCVHVRSSKGCAEILTKNNGRMRAENDEVFTLIPVKHGYLAGSYVLVESASVRGSEISKLYVLSQSKILHLVDVPRSVSKLDIDGFVSNAYLVQKTAHELNKFDASKGTQWYEIFCSDLPESCLGHPNFSKEVLKIFSGLGDIELVSAVDRKFINTKYCKEYAEKYFKALCERCKAIESGS